MLSRSLLFIMSLVLRCGIRIVYDRSSDAAVVHIIMNPRIGGIFGIEGPYHSTTMVDPETRDGAYTLHSAPRPGCNLSPSVPARQPTSSGYRRWKRNCCCRNSANCWNSAWSRRRFPLLSDFDESEDLLSSFLESSDFWSLSSDSFFSSVLAPVEIEGPIRFLHGAGILVIAPGHAHHRWTRCHRRSHVRRIR